MNETKANPPANLITPNPVSWGFDLVCTQINQGGSSHDNLTPLFDFVSDHETCFLEFKATPYMPDKPKSDNNPYGYDKGDSKDDYAWNVVKSIIALANTAGGAVVLGVTDKGHMPCPEICKRHWEGNKKWDEFSLSLHDQIIKKSYTVKPDEAVYKATGEKTTIELTDEACASLKDRCKIIRCCHYRGSTIPLIMVKPVQDTDDFIWVKENDDEILLVRECGDAGRSKRLKGRDAQRYKQPDADSYTASHNATCSSLKRYWNNLHEIQEIVGREVELKQLNRALRSRDNDNILWIQGAPGIGKTAFIQKYIQTYCREDSESPFDIAFFLSAQDQTFFETICRMTFDAASFEDFCGIKLNSSSCCALDEIFRFPENARPQLFRFWAQRLIEHLDEYGGPGRILIILDNASSPTFLCDEQLQWIRAQTQSKRIKLCVTSRFPPSTHEHISVFVLEQLTKDDALNILNSKRPIQDERDAAIEIVNRLNCNALAVNRIATQLKNDTDQAPYARMLDDLNKRGITSESIKTLFYPTIERLKGDSGCGDNAIRLFALSAWFKQDSIPEACLKDAFFQYLNDKQSITAPHDAESEWNRHISVLVHEGLLQWNPGKKAYKPLTFGQEILWDLPETYQVWQYAFDTFDAIVSDGQLLSRLYNHLINFLALTFSRYQTNPDQRKNARDAVKKIASKEKWKDLFSYTAEHFGYDDRIKSICAKLLRISKDEYKRNQRDSDTTDHYLFFLSIRKTLVQKWGSNVQGDFKKICEDTRNVFDKLHGKSEKKEIEFARILISDAKQNDKLYHYAIIEKDLETAFKIIEKYKDRELELFVKSHITRSKIELEFKKYRKVKKCLNALIGFTRKKDKAIPCEDLRRYYKEQLAYMYLCKSESSAGFARWFARRRALRKYNRLIDELSSQDCKNNTSNGLARWSARLRTLLRALLKRSKLSPVVIGKSEFDKTREFILFKSLYFKAIILLQQGKSNEANEVLDAALGMCDQIFNPDGTIVVNKKLLAFNNYRVKSGILRLQEKFDKAHEIDKMAFTCYKENFSDLANLELADLEDDYGNTYAQLGDFDKAIFHVNSALDIRKDLLPSTHVKIQRSSSRLAFLYGIRALKNGELAHKEIDKLINARNHDKDKERLQTYSAPIIEKLREITEFGNQEWKTYLDQLKNDEEAEECERVRSLIAELQEKLFDKWIKDHSTNK